LAPPLGELASAGKGFRKAVRLFGKRRRPRNGAKRCPKGSDEQSEVANDERGRTERKEKDRSLRGILSVVILSGTAKP